MKGLKDTTRIPPQYLRSALPRSPLDPFAHMVMVSAFRRAMSGLTSAFGGALPAFDVWAEGLAEVGRSMRRMNARVMAHRRKRHGPMRISSKPKHRQPDPRRIKGQRRMIKKAGRL